VILALLANMLQTMDHSTAQTVPLDNIPLLVLVSALIALKAKRPCSLELLNAQIALLESSSLAQAIKTVSNVMLASIKTCLAWRCAVLALQEPFPALDLLCVLHVAVALLHSIKIQVHAAPAWLERRALEIILLPMAPLIVMHALLEHSLLMALRLALLARVDLTATIPFRLLASSALLESRV